MSVELHHGDCLDVMATLDANSVDTVITDPPAGIAFMGKKWDNKTGYVARTDKGLRFLECGELLGLEAWEAGFVAFMIDCLVEAYRVAKPGAMFLIWALPRTADLTGLAMRVAGLEVRNSVTHIFSSGFPKSHNISKAIDKAAGAEREVIGPNKYAGRRIEGSGPGNGDACYGQYGIPGCETAPATPAAKLWDGYGTALKPAVEFWLLGMKPLDGTFASNALTWDCAGLNVDGGRIPTGETLSRHNNYRENNGYAGGPWKSGDFGTGDASGGRFPANLILSHHPECVRVGVRRVKGSNGKRGASTRIYGGGKGFTQATGESVGYTDPDGLETIPAWECHEDCPILELDRQSGTLTSGARENKTGERGAFGGDTCYGDSAGRTHSNHFESSTGGASRFFLNLPGEARFFYQAKASRSERNAGLDDFYWRKDKSVSFGFVRITRDEWEALPEKERAQGNVHATVKSRALMAALCRLTRTPTGGTVLDFCMGSGSTGLGCIDTDRDFVGIDRDRESFEIAQRRIEHAQNEIVQLALI